MMYPLTSGYSLKKYTIRLEDTQTGLRAGKSRLLPVDFEVLNFSIVIGLPLLQYISCFRGLAGSPEGCSIGWSLVVFEDTRTVHRFYLIMDYSVIRLTEHLLVSEPASECFIGTGLSSHRSLRGGDRCVYSAVRPTVHCSLGMFLSSGPIHKIIPSMI